MTESIVVDLRPEFDLTGDSDDDESTSDKIANVKVIDITGDADVREVIDVTEDDDEDEIVYLAVPTDEMDYVKAIGGAWYDKDAKKWCIRKRTLNKKR